MATKVTAGKKKNFKYTTPNIPSHKEIERKYILKRLPEELLSKKKHTILEITQYYFFIDGVWQRFRLATNRATGKMKYIHTIKQSLGIGVNDEKERSINEKLFKELYAQHKNNFRVIKKTRHVIKYKNLKFEIDYFNDLTLVMLEVELTKLNQHIEFPPLLLEEIIMEVTGYKQFSNLSLSFIHKSEKKKGTKDGKRIK